MPHPPSWFDWLTVAAIFLGPVFALFAQRVLDRIREKKQRRFLVYTTLMSLRSDPLNPDHVRALNSLDAVFDRRWGKDKNVRQAWDRLLAHVTTPRAANPPVWDATTLDLRVDVYQAVGRAVGYDHTVEYIKNHIYMPDFFQQVFTEQTQIRKSLAGALTPDGLKVIDNTPAPPAPAAGLPRIGLPGAPRR